MSARLPRKFLIDSSSKFQKRIGADPIPRRMSVRKTLLHFAAIALGAMALRSDVITLRNGTAIKGTLQTANREQVWVNVKAKATSYPAADVALPVASGSSNCPRHFQLGFGTSKQQAFLKRLPDQMRLGRRSQGRGHDVSRLRALA